jgi:aryl-alcohol dehydrogenase-like predicted oxidoreductase
VNYRRLGEAELEVPVVIFGGWTIGGWYWGGADDSESIKAIERALDLGINCFDTAPAYGFGHSERILARALEGKRKEVIIATKCGLRWDEKLGQLQFETTDSSGHVRMVFKNLSKDSIVYECEQSLKRLKTDYIDLYQCHWPDEATPLEETMGALLSLKDQGKIRAIGVSNFTTRLMERCLMIGDLASHQCRYSLLAREIEKEILPFSIDSNLGVICYGPLGQGLLTGKVTMDRKFTEDDLRETFQVWFKPANRKRVLSALERIEPIARKYDATLAQLAINWVISQAGVTAAIVGARTAAQVEENAKAADFELSEDDLQSLKEEFEALGEPIE